MAIIFTTLFVALQASSNNILAKKVECGDQKWDPTGHDGNKPSSSKWKHDVYRIGLCQLAKGVDWEIYPNHKSIDWNHFTTSPAFVKATEDQQKCMTTYHKDGHGMKGFGGYELLYCAIDDD